MKALLDHPLLVILADLSRKLPGTGGLHLVGGAIRDALLQRPVADFDFTSPHDPTPMARTLARQLKGQWFWLDKERCQSRVLAEDCTCDFAPFRAPTLAGDLAARDFTINAMALDLAGPLDAGALVDPLGGKDDLSGKILRYAGPEVLLDDPLRILKGIRHAVELELTVEPATLDAMQNAATRLPVIAPERLRLELWRILAAPAALRGIDDLMLSGAGEVLFGAGLLAARPAIHQRLTRVQVLFAELSATAPVLADWLQAPIEQGMDRATLLRWHYVLAAIDPDLPLTLARNWRFSRLALNRLAALHRLRPELWQALRSLPSRPRPIALWAQQFGPDPVDLLVTLGLLQEGEPMLIRDGLVPMLLHLAELPDPQQVVPLVDGHWLQTTMGVTGKAVGAAQAMLRAAEIRGEIGDVDEARRYLSQQLRKRC